MSGSCPISFSLHSSVHCAVIILHYIQICHENGTHFNYIYKIAQDEVNDTATNESHIRNRDTHPVDAEVLQYVDRPVMSFLVLSLWAYHHHGWRYFWKYRRQ